MAKSDTVKVKILRSHPKFAYYAGETGEISREDFDKYSADGPFFEEVKSKATQSEPEAEAPPTDGPKQRRQTR